MVIFVIVTISLPPLSDIYSVDAATPFFANDAFTQNGIEWCEENLSLYQILGNKFFDHHKHSIESRVCVSLYNDPLWTYNGPDRYEKLIEKSRYYVALEIAESAEEAQTGVVDPTPAMTRENKTEVKEEIKEPVCKPGEILIDGKCSTTEIQTPEGGGCLIATATYGSELSPQVQLLRETRDNTLLQTDSGSSFMELFNKIYYSFSPTIADWERQNYAFKESVKITITPLLMSLSILNHVDIDSEQEMLGYGIGIILMNVGMYFVAPAILISKIRTKF
ncbi:MAG TPA: CFI-box-CTERM domain-containing protein [Nitrosopumilaceae archaeon]|nr:CFI-box-CTERM domain-containing protein [Nitrosopumilaceae archaeon]